MAAPRRGFTLIEIIVVIVILGVLAALAVPAFRAQTERSAQATTGTSLSALDRQIRALAASDQTDPLSVAGTALRDLPGSRGLVDPPSRTVYLQLGQRTGKIVYPPAGSSTASTPATVSAFEARARSLYSAVILDGGPVAYWRADDTGGTTLRDLTAAERHATVTGTVSVGAPGALTGDNNRATGFDPGLTGPHASVPFAFPALSDLTLEAWVYPTANPVSVADGILTTDVGANGPRLTWGSNSGSNPVFTLFTNRLAPLAAGPGAYGTTMPLNTWHHVVGTISGASTAAPVLRLYVNGVLQASATADRAVDTGNTTIHLGRRDSAVGFPGRLDELAVYTRALSASEVAAHYAAGTTS